MCDGLLQCKLLIIENVNNSVPFEIEQRYHYNLESLPVVGNDGINYVWSDLMENVFNIFFKFLILIRFSLNF